MSSYGADEILGEQFKGVPLGSRLRLSELGSQRWNVLRGDTATPVAVLRDHAIESNIETMRRFCERAGVSLAPHAKTTMSPQLVSAQHAAGAWAFTVAVPHQGQLLWEFGAERLLLANELVDPAALSWVADQLDSDPARELVTYVDSRAGADAAQEAMVTSGCDRPLPVLIELGHANGRTGVRTVAEALELAEHVSTSSHLTLAGVAGYEGTIATTRNAEAVARVDEFLADMGHLARALIASGALDPRTGPIITAGGSIFFDRVATAFEPLRDLGFRVVLRSGCYLIHDHGLYDRATPDAQPDWTFGTFEPALEIWARVVSRPESRLALVNAGRRDLSIDGGYPVPLAAHRPVDGTQVDIAGAEVSALSDQHAFLAISPETDLRVGDLVGLGISHPCTTFDRWRLILRVDEQYNVVGGVRTYF
jgi:D-serine dehydratase